MIRKTFAMLLALLSLFLLPVAAHGAIFYAKGWPQSWRTADWSSAGILPRPSEFEDATIRVYAARTGRWKGILAVHSWIVTKSESARSYDRYDVVGWGTPVRVNAYPPDGRWYGNPPRLVFALEGPRAEALIPKIAAAVEEYRYRQRGDYTVWPGPNSNTFVAYVLSRVPELGAHLPPTAIGKDYPIEGAIAARSPSGTGFTLNLGGLAGVTIGWIEGFEVNLLGLVVGFDLRRPALKLPGFGRVGVPIQPGGEV